MRPRSYLLILIIVLSGLTFSGCLTFPLVKGKQRLGPCVATPSKFVAIGLNYVDHAKETGSPIPEHPVVFGNLGVHAEGGDIVYPGSSP